MSKIEWKEVVLSYKKWEQPGDKVHGQVLHYSPQGGATTFDGKECGFLDLDRRDGQVLRIVLDKAALCDRIQAAYPEKGQWLGIKFVEEKQTDKGQPYKVFNVYKGKVVIE